MIDSMLLDTVSAGFHFIFETVWIQQYVGVMRVVVQVHDAQLWIELDLVCACFLTANCFRVVWNQPWKQSTVKTPLGRELALQVCSLVIVAKSSWLVMFIYLAGDWWAVIVQGQYQMCSTCAAKLVWHYPWPIGIHTLWSVEDMFRVGV